MQGGAQPGGSAQDDTQQGSEAIGGEQSEVGAPHGEVQGGQQQGDGVEDDAQQDNVQDYAEQDDGVQGGPQQDGAEDRGEQQNVAVHQQRGGVPQGCTLAEDIKERYKVCVKHTICSYKIEKRRLMLFRLQPAE